MIEVSTYRSNNSSTVVRDINKDDSMLILGKGSKESKLGDIYKPTSINDAKSIYGDSELVDSYELAVNCGAKNIYLMNCYEFTDFITAVNYICHYNFAFIVPIGIKLSEKFYLESEDREVYFAEYYLGVSNGHSNSVIVMTDEHSDLYENIDSFLSDMHLKVKLFKSSTDYIISTQGRGLAFVLNMIKNVDYSSIYLAASLCKSKIAQHPSNNKNFSSDIYMDSEDVYSDEIIYFKDNFISGLSIENLKNFRIEKDANKIIAIDRVIKYIERHMDTSFVLGKSYDQYVKLMLHDYVDAFLRRQVGEIINNYKISNIDFYIAGEKSLNVVIEFNITPINSLESIDMRMEGR